MRRPTAYAMCGLAFSGKSSAARRIARQLDAALISLDEINHERGLRGGDGIPIAEWEETSLIAMDRLRATLREGRSAVVDDTFSHRFLRDRCRSVAEHCEAGFAILYMTTALDVIAVRRTENDRRPSRHGVRDEVFETHRKEFQHPSDDEPVIRINGDVDLERWLSAEMARRA